MAVKPNRPGIANARSLIRSGKISHGGWDEAAIDRSPKNAGAFLAIDTDFKPEVQDHWKFPVAQGGAVNRKALGTAIGYAKKSGYSAVASEAQKLADEADKKAGAAANGAGKRFVGLRGPTTYSDKTVQVDEQNGVLRGVSLMTIGPALGHPFTIDATTLAQLVALSNAQPDGVKCRFGHPAVEDTTDAEGNPVQRIADDTGTLIGRFKNVRIDGPQARGDLYLGTYAENLPGLGNVRQYLLSHAKEDPTGIGLSAFFTFHVEPAYDDFGNVTTCPARLEDLEAIDIVGQPAANPRGLLSAQAGTFDPRPSGWSDDNPQDPARAPIPPSTPEFPNDVRGAYLAAIVRDGPLSIGGLAARFNGRLEAMRAGADWLVSNGYAEKIPGKLAGYRATAKGLAAVHKTDLWKK